MPLVCKSKEKCDKNAKKYFKQLQGMMKESTSKRVEKFRL